MSELKDQNERINQLRKTRRAAIGTAMVQMRSALAREGMSTQVTLLIDPKDFQEVLRCMDKQDLTGSAWIKDGQVGGVSLGGAVIKPRYSSG